MMNHLYKSFSFFIVVALGSGSSALFANRPIQNNQTLRERGPLQNLGEAFQKAMKHNVHSNIQHLYPLINDQTDIMKDKLKYLIMVSLFPARTHGDKGTIYSSPDNRFSTIKKSFYIPDLTIEQWLQSVIFGSMSFSSQAALEITKFTTKNAYQYYTGESIQETLYKKFASQIGLSDLFVELGIDMMQQKTLKIELFVDKLIDHLTQKILSYDFSYDDNKDQQTSLIAKASDFIFSFFGNTNQNANNTKNENTSQEDVISNSTLKPEKRFPVNQTNHQANEISEENLNAALSNIFIDPLAIQKAHENELIERLNTESNKNSNEPAVQSSNQVNYMFFENKNPEQKEEDFYSYQGNEGDDDQDLFYSFQNNEDHEELMRDMQDLNTIHANSSVDINSFYTNIAEAPIASTDAQSKPETNLNPYLTQKQFEDLKAKLDQRSFDEIKEIDGKTTLFSYINRKIFETKSWLNELLRESFLNAAKMMLEKQKEQILDPIKQFVDQSIGAQIADAIYPDSSRKDYQKANYAFDPIEWLYQQASQAVSKTISKTLRYFIETKVSYVTNDIANYFLTNSINIKMNKIDDYIRYNCALFKFTEKDVINNYINFYEHENGDTTYIQKYPKTEFLGNPQKFVCDITYNTGYDLTSKLFGTIGGSLQKLKDFGLKAVYGSESSDHIEKNTHKKIDKEEQKHPVQPVQEPAQQSGSWWNKAGNWISGIKTAYL